MQLYDPFIWLLVFVALAAFIAIKLKGAVSRGKISIIISDGNEVRALVVDEPEDAPRELVAGSVLTAGVNELTLDIKSANVEVNHDETAQAVSWTTTCPDHFTGENGIVQQTNYRRTFRTANRDRLVVTVPANFEGGLTLRLADASSVTVDHWQYGNVTVESNGAGEIRFGDLTAVLALNATSNNDAEITLGDINGQSANFKLASSGNVSAGKVTLTGKFNAELTDDGNLTTGAIKASRVDLDSTDDGDILTGHIESASEVNVNTGDGENDFMNAEITIESITAGDRVDIDNGGDRKITIGEISSKRGAVNLTTRLDGGIDTGNIHAQSVTITTYDDGPVVTGEIASDTTVKIETGDGETDCLNAEVTARSIKAGTRVDIDLGGDGDVTFGALQCSSFTGEVNHDGNLTIGAARVEGKFTASAKNSGDITVDSCVADELRLDADDSGTIYVNGGSAPCVLVSGKVELADSFEHVWEKR